MLNILVLASIISGPVFLYIPMSIFHSESYYIELFCQDYGKIMSQNHRLTKFKCCSQELGRFDNRSGSCLDPNHFVPVARKTHHYGRPTMRHRKRNFEQAKKSVKPKVQPTRFECQRKSGHVPQTSPSKPSEKRTLEKAGLDDCLYVQNIKKTASPASASTQTRKFLPKWKEEFPWLLFSKEDNSMTCSICLAAPDSREITVYFWMHFC